MSEGFFFKKSSLFCFFLFILFAPTVHAQDAGTVNFPAVGPYNGFLGQTNIVECVNLGTQATNLRLSITRYDGTQLASQTQSIASNGKYDFILNAIAAQNGQSIADDIGTFRLEKLDSNFNVKIVCMVVFYRFRVDGELEYAFNLPVGTPHYGNRYGVFNLNDPSTLNPSIRTWNILSVYNPGATDFEAMVRAYGANGNFLQAFAVVLAPRQRQDILLHNLPESTGFYEIVPVNAAKGYGAFMARYRTVNGGSTFDWAMMSDAYRGSCNDTLAATTTANANNIVTIANAETSSQDITFQVRNSDGAVVHTRDITLEARAQTAVVVDQYLGPWAIGQVSVICDDSNQEVVFESAYYGHPSAGVLPVNWAYASQPTGLPPATSGQTLAGLGNTFLRAFNWTKLSNSSMGSANVGATVFNSAGSAIGGRNFGMSALGSFDFDVHSVLPANQVGTVVVSSGTSSVQLSGETVRVYLDAFGNIIEQMPTRMAIIDSQITAQSDFAGNPNSLAPYRDSLTDREIRHLFKKVALGGTDAWFSRARNQGLENLVNRMVNEPLDQTVEEAALALGLANINQSDLDWETDAIQDYWIHIMRYSPNPFREKMSLIWHDHLATDLNAFNGNNERHQYLPQHLALLRNNAFDFRGFVHGLHWDGANATALNLIDNHCGLIGNDETPACNENYPREYLELLLVGQFDPYTGEANYTEDDVVNRITPALSGFTDEFISDPRTVVTAFSPWLWQANPYQPEPVRLFPGKPYETVSTFSFPDDPFRPYYYTTEYMLSAVPMVPRYLAYSLFTRLVNFHPDEAIVNELASDLLETDYDIKFVVRKILRSQAMFSNYSRYTCVQDPIENLVSFFRILDLPVVEVPGEDIPQVIQDAAEEMGQNLLVPDTVFGYGGCFGHTGTQEGAAFLAPQRLLEGVKRNIRQVMNELDDVRFDDDFLSAGGIFGWEQMLPFEAAPPPAIVDHLSAKLNLELGSGERAWLINYLRVGRDSSGVEIDFAEVWDNPLHPQYNNLVDLKIPRLLSLMFSHWSNYLK